MTHITQQAVKRVGFCFLGCLLVGLLLPQTPRAADTEKTFDRSPKNLGSVLIFSGTGWYRHPEVAALSGWLARLDKTLGMQVDVSESPADLVQILKHYRVLVLNNCTEMTAILNATERKAVEDWHAAGGGIVALHASLVRQTGWDWFNQMAGCDFDSDSEFLEALVEVDPEAKDHPSVRGQGAKFLYKADWTNHDRSVTGLPGFKVLLRVNESTYQPVRKLFRERGGKAMGSDHPIAWLHTLGGGRFFYTELGHDVRSLETDFGRQHITEAIRWAAAP
ncbi:ThuA domain-containing protein [bacterium]|nr:ThuA domain-containing protein [bacterium]MDG1891889.1 ThuA domain-containing protein [Verrucomicrobiota bacterium]